MSQQTEWDLSVEELEQMRDAAADFVLVDVRNPAEYEATNLGGNLIPLSTLAARIEELDRAAHIVVHCKSGGRSSKAVTLLRQAGFGNVWNVHGGIDAWIERIDPNLAKS